MALTNPFSAPLWKVGAIGALALNVVLSGFLFASYIEKEEIARQRDDFRVAIEDPVTGYVARLTTAQNNVVVLEQAVAASNKRYDDLSRESAERLRIAREELLKVQKERQKLDAQVQRFLNEKIEGDTLEERIRDVDARAMKEFLNEE